MFIVDTEEDDLNSLSAGEFNGGCTLSVSLSVAVASSFVLMTFQVGQYARDRLAKSFKE